MTERAIAGGRQPEGGFEDAGEMGLIGESRVDGNLGERMPFADPVPRELQTTHQEVPVRAGPAPEPELTAQIVAGQARDQLELRRAHDARPLDIEVLSRPLHGGDVDAPREMRPRSGPLAGQQSIGEIDDEIVDGQRLELDAKSLLD